MCSNLQRISAELVALVTTKANTIDVLLGLGHVLCQ
jgi:hypothetical protein